MIREMYPSNFAEFYGLLNRLPSSDREELKVSIVRQFTAGRTESLREMFLKEYRDACIALRKLVPPDGREVMQKELRRARSEALHQMQLLGIDTADWSVIDRFCNNPRIAGKPFKELDTDELRKVSIKVRMIRKKKEQELSQ